MISISIVVRRVNVYALYLPIICRNKFWKDVFIVTLYQYVFAILIANRINWINGKFYIIF